MENKYRRAKIPSVQYVPITMLRGDVLKYIRNENLLIIVQTKKKKKKWKFFKKKSFFFVITNPASPLSAPALASLDKIHFFNWKITIFNTAHNQYSDNKSKKNYKLWSLSCCFASRASAAWRCCAVHSREWRQCRREWLRRSTHPIVDEMHDKWLNICLNGEK